MSVTVDVSKKNTNTYKLAAAFVGVCAAVYGLYTKQSGDATFSLVIAFLLFMSLDPPSLDPKATLKEFGQYSFATIYESATTWIRQAFQYGDKFVRAMMTLLALGATASLVKYGIRNFSMFPDILDVWVKRLGPALAIVSMVIYPAALISKRIFKLSEHAGDEVVRSHELRFYTTVVLFSLTVFILFAGLKVETLVGSSKPTGAYSIEGHEESSIKIMVTFSLIWLVWAISSGACIFSRLLEWEWRGTNAEGGGLQRAGATGSAST